MKPLNYLILSFCVILLANCQKKEVPAELQGQLDSIAAVMVPQSGEALCDISMALTGRKTITVRGETNLPEARDAVLKMLTGSGYSFTDSITLLPDPAVVENPWGLVSVSVCNMRTKPSHAAEMATQALLGTPVRILNKRGGWLLVQTPDSYLGWTDDPVTEMSDSAIGAWKSGKRLIYTQHTGVITDTEGQTVSDIVFGDIVEKTGENKDKFMIRLPDGREGLIGKACAADFRVWAEETVPDAATMTKFARTFLGAPYLWGGTSTKGVDCSGFTKTIYYSAGVIITRDASGQYRYGQERSIENAGTSLVPGDLLFFGRVRDGRKRITHTGMYIGDSEFIHSSRLVKINSLDSTRANFSKYHLDILQGARGIIGVAPGEGIIRISQHTWYF